MYLKYFVNLESWYVSVCWYLTANQGPTIMQIEQCCHHLSGKNYILATWKTHYQRKEKTTLQFNSQNRY